MKSKSLTMHLILTMTTLALAMSSSPANGTTDSANAVLIPQSAFRIPQLQYNPPTVEESPLLAQAEGGQPVDVYGFKRKSPARAFLQSFLIPGWGQLYAKSAFWKPIAAVGIEAAGWAGYFSFNGKGHDLEDEYRAFADQHWDDSSYVWGLYETFYSRDYPNSIRNDGSTLNLYLDTTTYVVVDNQNVIHARSLSHHAWFKEDGSAVESNEFYENIGKYNQFNFGWDDFPSIGSDSFPAHPDSTQLTYVSPHRATYLGMRDDANSELNKANTMLVVTVANHLLWGFWAALDARAFNRAQDQFGTVQTNLQLVKSPADPMKYMPYLTMTYRF